MKVVEGQEAMTEIPSVHRDFLQQKYGRKQPDPERFEESQRQQQGQGSAMAHKAAAAGASPLSSEPKTSKGSRPAAVLDLSPTAIELLKKLRMKR